MTAQENIYVQRINQVLNYIRSKVAGDLSLHTLAQVAGFSPYHFHRIFKFITGENVNQVVRRLRLERAAALLRASPQARITDIALECGFSSSGDFSRSFKEYFGLAPRTWDRRSPLRPDLKADKPVEVHEPLIWYTDEMLAAVAAQGEFPITVKPFPACRIAYICVPNAYQMGRLITAYDQLMAWLAVNCPDLSRSTLFGMSQDDPEITPHEQSSYDICMTLPEGVTATPDDIVSIRQLPACTVACVTVVGDLYVVDRAYQYLFKYWLPRSRYWPDNLPGMEIYRRLPAEIGWETFDLEGCLPVVAM